MKKIILADNYEVFRAGTAKVLAMEDDLRIVAQCPDCARLYHAMATFRDSIIIVAFSLRADLPRVIAGARDASSRVIIVAENGDPPPPSVLSELQGLVYRNVGCSALIDCVRRVMRGERTIQPAGTNGSAEGEDEVGARVRDRLTHKEMKIVGLIVEGCKNREIALRMGTSEQVIKNYLRNIYDKTGVSDRLELALFTIHHRTLAEAATAVRPLKGGDRPRPTSFLGGIPIHARPQ